MNSRFPCPEEANSRVKPLDKKKKKAKKDKADKKYNLDYKDAAKETEPIV